jgi:hypothetical protein
MQELHETSIRKALSKASKSAKPSTEATPPADDKPESSYVMIVHLEWHTESASRPPCGFWRIDDQHLDI